MSFIDKQGKTSGYSVELCRYIASAVRRHLDMPDLKIEYVPLIAPQQRIDAVVNGDVDIECGATTVTLSRREKVDFTLMTFITGGSVLSTAKRPITTLDDLRGHTIAVIEGTTTETAIRHFGDVNEYKFNLRLIGTHDEGISLLQKGEVDGYASDRVMLLGQVFRSADAGNYVLTRRAFSFEPYSLMVRRGDTEFRLLADRALASLYRDARIRRLYQDWFGRYGEAMTPILEAMYEFQAVRD
jgi:ABC-type amino acid transport substrate-binding protein